MALNATTTIIGNLTKDPELKFTPGGMPICNLSIAWNNRRKGPNGEQIDETSYFDATAKFKLAENIAETHQKGDRIIIHGHYQQRTWTTPDGEKRSKIELQIENCGPDLTWATATITRNPKDNPQPPQNQPRNQPDNQPDNQPTRNQPGDNFDWSNYETDF